MSIVIKRLAFALIATLAVLAFTSPLANAAGRFTWLSAKKVFLLKDSTGGSQTWGFNPGHVTCNEVSGSAELAFAESTELTITELTYNNSGSADTCPGPFGTSTKIETSLCGLGFNSGDTIGTSGMETTGNVRIVCFFGGTAMKFTFPGCTIEVPAQTPTGGHIVYRTITNPISDITLEYTVSGIHYSTSGFLCGTHTTETNGTLSGNSLLVGQTSSSFHTSIEVH